MNISQWILVPMALVLAVTLAQAIPTTSVSKLEPCNEEDVFKKAVLGEVHQFVEDLYSGRIVNNITCLHSIDDRIQFCQVFLVLEDEPVRIKLELPNY